MYIYLHIVRRHKTYFTFFTIKKKYFAILTKLGSKIYVPN